MGHGIVESLKKLGDCILSVIYCGDENCILCGREIYSGNFICQCCEKQIMPCFDKGFVETDNIEFDCYSGAYYSGTMMELVMKLKYKKSFFSGDVMAQYMYNTIKRHNLEFDIITYVPMTRKDLRKRGYNQSLYLANVLKKHTGKPVLSCLKKIRGTKDQIGLDKKLRWKNISGSFEILPNVEIWGKNVIVVDDVVTTGATAFYCALELKKAGANKITILTGAKSKV